MNLKKHKQLDIEDLITIAENDAESAAFFNDNSSIPAPVKTPKVTERVEVKGMSYSLKTLSINLRIPNWYETNILKTK